MTTSSTSAICEFVYAYLHFYIQYSEIIPFSFVGLVWQSGCNDISILPQNKAILKDFYFYALHTHLSSLHHFLLPIPCTGTAICDALLEIVLVK